MVNVVFCLLSWFCWKFRFQEQKSACTFYLSSVDTVAKPIGSTPYVSAKERSGQFG